MRWVTVFIIAAALLFAACGGDDDTEADPDRPADITELDDEVEGETIIAPTPTAVPAVIEPERLSYAVQDGDLLGSIANTFNVPLGALIWVNELDNPDLIQIGQELVIPTEDDVAEWEAIEATAAETEPTEEPEPSPEADADTDDGGG